MRKVLTLTIEMYSVYFYLYRESFLCTSQHCTTLFSYLQLNASQHSASSLVLYSSSETVVASEHFSYYAAVIHSLNLHFPCQLRGSNQWPYHSKPAPLAFKAAASPQQCPLFIIAWRVTKCRYIKNNALFKKSNLVIKEVSRGIITNGSLNFELFKKLSH